MDAIIFLSGGRRKHKKSLLKKVYFFVRWKVESNRGQALDEGNRCRKLEMPCTASHLQTMSHLKNVTGLIRCFWSEGEMGTMPGVQYREGRKNHIGYQPPRLKRGKRKG